MRAFFVLHSPRDPHAAVFAYAQQRAACLERAGHSTDILCPHDLPGLERATPRWLPLTYALRLARFVRTASPVPDVTVFHSWTGWCYRRPRGVRQPRVVTQFHGLEPLAFRRMQAEMTLIGRPFSLRYRLIHGWVMRHLLAAACRRSDAVLCLNREERAYLIDHGWATADRVHVVPNAAPDEFFVKRDYHAHASRLLFLGQWQPGKGGRYLASAFERLSSTRPKLELVCAGTLARADEVLADFSPACRPRVTVVPRANRDTLISLFVSADIFVFPSLTEGSSLALLEAMAMGLPIVTTPVGAAPDLLEDERSVLFVSPAETAPLVAALERLLNDLALRERLGAGARQAAEGCRWSRLEGDYLELMESIAAGRPRQEATA